MKPTEQADLLQNDHPGIASAEPKYNCLDGILFTALSSKKYLKTVVDGEACLFMRMCTVLRNDMRKVSRLHVSFIANCRSLTYPHVYVQQTTCIRDCSLFGSLDRATRCMCGPTYTKLLFILAGLVFFTLLAKIT